MLTFIAFVLMLAGSINWLLIGMLQYDFIAGLFGYQASIFSRIFYILFGIGAVYVIVRIIVNKGSVKIFEKRKNKQQKHKRDERQATANIEASRESVSSRHNFDDVDDNFESNSHYTSHDNMFDEHLRKDL